jgi:hypothetical protein
MRKWTLVAAALLFTAPTTWASTYFGGFEDTVGTRYTYSDYDYNDLVFSITGQTLTLISNGTWYTKPHLGTNGTPFWNHSSSDGNEMNVGYCIYGGGNCGAGLDRSALYLASRHKQSVENVYFSVNGSLTGEIDIKYTSDHNLLGWYSVGDPYHSIHWLSGNVGSVFSFTPTGDFGLIASNNNGSIWGQNFYSQDYYGTQDDQSHFAFFAAEAPEPGQIGLLAIGLLGVSLFLKKRITTAKS